MIRGAQRPWAELVPVGLVTALMGLACDPGLPKGDSPPDGALYYPMGIAVAPDSAGEPRYAYVVNTNFDQRYNAGWISTVDLDAVDAGTLTILKQSVKVPSLGGHIVVSDSGDQVLAGYRGAGIITALDVREGTGGLLSCGDKPSNPPVPPAYRQTDCDADHLIDVRRVGFDADFETSDLKDPFTVSYFRAPDGTPRVAATFMSSGWLALFRVPGKEPDAGARLLPERLLRVSSGGALGAVEPLTVSAGENRECAFLLATSQYLSRTSERSGLYSVDIARLLAGEDDVVNAHSVSADAGGTEIEELVVSPDGTRAFVLNRAPDALLMLRVEAERCRDPGDDEGAAVDVRVVSGLAVEGRPTAVAYVDRQNRADLLAVTSLEGDAVFVVAIEGDSLVLVHRFDGLPVGRGPIGVAHARRGGRDLLLVTTFYDHGLSVFDVSSQSPHDFVHLAHVGNAALDDAAPAR